MIPVTNAGAIRQRQTPEDHISSTSDSDLSSIFFKWAQESLFINTELVEIQNFFYPDYIRAMKDKIDIFYDEENQYYNSYFQTTLGDEQPNENEQPNEDGEDEEEEYPMDEDEMLSIQQYPSIATRGLAASRDISIGQVILQIPHSALWTVTNRIDKDPILSQAMGLKQRMKYGWNSQIDEIPLLTVALLYHFQLHRQAEKENGISPHWAYLQLLEETNVHDRIPHMWDSKTLRRSTTIGVRKVSKGIQKDVKELYGRIVGTLIQDFPDMFGNHKEVNHLLEDELLEEDESDDSEWMFSLERFHWAFAIINSRHWHLPIPDDTEEEDEEKEEELPKQDLSGEQQHLEEEEDPSLSNIQFDDNASPPASMPTDEWMDLQQHLEHHRDEGPSPTQDTEDDNTDWPVGNSFLAPLADLLNFGPPCTRGVYNTSTHSFDIVATCNISKGQEITFWYADACQDIFMANYGFTMPLLVLPCQPTFEDHMTNTQYALRVEKELMLTLDELEQMDSEMEHLVKILKACQCDKIKGKEHYFTSLLNNSAHKRNASSANSPVVPPPNNKFKRNKSSKKGDQNARHAIRAANQMPSVASSSNKSDGSLKRSRKRRAGSSVRDL